MPQFLVVFGADTSSSICFGEIRALLNNAGLDANELLPKDTWEVLENPCLVLNFPSSQLGHLVLSNLVTAKAYYELLVASRTFTSAVSQLEALSLSPSNALFAVSFVSFNIYRIQLH